MPAARRSRLPFECGRHLADGADDPRGSAAAAPTTCAPPAPMPQPTAARRPAHRLAAGRRGPGRLPDDASAQGGVLGAFAQGSIRLFLAGEHSSWGQDAGHAGRDHQCGNAGTVADGAGGAWPMVGRIGGRGSALWFPAADVTAQDGAQVIYAERATGGTPPQPLHLLRTVRGAHGEVRAASGGSIAYASAGAEHFPQPRQWLRHPVDRHSPGRLRSTAEGSWGSAASHCRCLPTRSDDGGPRRRRLCRRQGQHRRRRRGAAAPRLPPPEQREHRLLRRQLRGARNAASLASGFAIKLLRVIDATVLDY